MHALLNRTYPGVGLLLIRVMVGIVFLFHGAQKLFGIWGGGGIEGTAAFFGEKLNMPFPTVNAYLAGGAEFFGGIAFVAGFGWRFAGVVLAFTMLVAAFSAHWGAFSGQAGGMEYPLTLALVSLGIALAGPGTCTLGAFLGGPGSPERETHGVD